MIGGALRLRGAPEGPPENEDRRNYRPPKLKKSWKFCLFFIAKKRILVRSIMTALIIFVVFVGIVTVLWVGARDVRLGVISPGYLVQFVIYSGFVAGAVAALSEIFGELQRAAGATERIVEILRSEDPVKQPKIINQPDFECEIAIKFSNITFSYPLRPTDAILDGFCEMWKRCDVM